MTPLATAGDPGDLCPSPMAIERAIAGLGPCILTATAYRQISPQWNPRSGEGARSFGGRFNPPGSFPCLYLALSMETAGAELRRRASGQPIGLEGLLPRHVYAYTLDAVRCVDLREGDVRDAIDIPLDAITSARWDCTQQLGECAFRLGVPAIVAPSATGVGDIAAVFPTLLSSDLEPLLVTTWHSATDLPTGSAIGSAA